MALLTALVAEQLPLHLRTSVFLRLTSNPNLAYASDGFEMVSCRPSGECESKAQSSAYWSSTNLALWVIVRTLSF